MYWRPVTGAPTAVPGRRRTGAASVRLGPMRLLVLDPNGAEAQCCRHQVGSCPVMVNCVVLSGYLIPYTLS